MIDHGGGWSKRTVLHLLLRSPYLAVETDFGAPRWNGRAKRELTAAGDGRRITHASVTGAFDVRARPTLLSNVL
jgi:hypothetical protein